MKIRNGFVSNSSSTAFIITNKTNKEKTIVDFVRENPQIVQEFIDRYYRHPNSDSSRYTQEALIKSAKENLIYLKPGDNHVVFGDEDGTLIGDVFDYQLRDCGESKSFTWCFEEYYR